MLLPLCSPTAIARPHAHVQTQALQQVIDSATYNQVLDLLFPRGQTTGPRVVYSLVIRVQPNDSPEYQVVILRMHDRTDVIAYRPLTDVWDTLNQRINSGASRDPHELARGIEVRERALSIPKAKVDRWFEGFFASFDGTGRALADRVRGFEKAGGESVLLHGTFYRVWYENALNDLAFKFYDVGPGRDAKAADFRMVKWINSVLDDIRALERGPGATK